MTSFSHNEADNKPSKRNLIIGYSLAAGVIVLVIGIMIMIGVGEIQYTPTH